MLKSLSNEQKAMGRGRGVGVQRYGKDYGCDPANGAVARTHWAMLRLSPSCAHQRGAQPNARARARTHARTRKHAHALYDAVTHRHRHRHRHTDTPTHARTQASTHALTHARKHALGNAVAQLRLHHVEDEVLRRP